MDHSLAAGCPVGDISGIGLVCNCEPFHKAGAGNGVSFATMAAAHTPVSTGNLIKVGTGDVLVGMFVSELDRNWSETPFPLGGFHVKNADDILLLQKFCKTVTIDINKSAEPARRRRSNLTILSSARRAAPAGASLKVNRDAYPVTQTVKQLIDKAAQSYAELVQTMAGVGKAVRNGDRLDLAALEQPSATMVECLLANPQVLIWILGTEDEPQTTNTYCVRAAIWAGILARQFGLKQKDIELLFQSTLVADIGMHLLPERLVNKRGPFRKKEYLAYRKHVDFGLELLNSQQEVDERLLRVVRAHHERHDGLGFPKGLKGDQIPVLARFAALAYSYERLLRSNDRKRRVSPARAIAKLYRQRKLKFPEQLVVEFIHLLGTYPVGSLVQLDNGDIALVLEQNDNERLSPKVAVIADATLQPLAKPKPLDLAAQKDKDNGRRIKTSVNPGEVDLNLSDYRFQFAGKRLALAGFAFRF